MVGIAFALIVIGLIVLFVFPILGLVVGVIGVLLLVGLLIGRRRRAAADSGGP